MFDLLMPLFTQAALAITPAQKQTAAKIFHVGDTLRPLTVMTPAK